MKYNIEQNFKTPRNVSVDLVKKYVGNDSNLGIVIVIGQYLSGFIAIVCVVVSLIFSVSWKWAIIFGTISVACYLYDKITYKSAIDKRVKDFANLPISYAGLVTYWGRIFTDKTDGLAIIVYSTDQLLMHNEAYISEVTRNMYAMLYDDNESTLSNEESKIRKAILNDEKGRYNVKTGTPIPINRGNKGNTFISSQHFDFKIFPENFDPEEDLIGFYLENGKPLQPLFPELYTIK